MDDALTLWSESSLILLLFFTVICVVQHSKGIVRSVEAMEANFETVAKRQKKQLQRRRDSFNFHFGFHRNLTSAHCL